MRWRVPPGKLFVTYLLLRGRNVEEVLEKYNFKVDKTGRAKGAVLLETKEGLYLVKEITGVDKHLEFEEKLLNEISDYSDICVDNIVRNVDGEILTETSGGQKYLVRKWYPSKDMEPKNISQSVKAAGMLAKLHNTFNEISKMPKIQECIEDGEDVDRYVEDVVNEADRHNTELKRTRNFIRGKRKKNKFELMILESFDDFYTEGIEAARNLTAPEVRTFITESIFENHLIHGAYNYHNVLLCNDKMVITNFSHSKRGIQVRDLYDYLRKVMEKHNWNPEIGLKILREYQNNRRLSWEELQYLGLKLSYPEKYWKILNHYFNSKKAWIPDKDVVKLSTVVEQRNKRRQFANMLKYQN